MVSTRLLSTNCIHRNIWKVRYWCISSLEKIDYTRKHVICSDNFRINDIQNLMTDSSNVICKRLLVFYICFANLYIYYTLSEFWLQMKLLLLLLVVFLFLFLFWSFGRRLSWSDTCTRVVRVHIQNTYIHMLLIFCLFLYETISFSRSYTRHLEVINKRSTTISSRWLFIGMAKILLVRLCYKSWNK